jgi:hypothetical protein
MRKLLVVLISTNPYNCFTYILVEPKFNFSRNIHYIDFEGCEHYYSTHEFPVHLEKKVKLLNYFMNYMKEHLLKAGANIEVGL